MYEMYIHISPKVDSNKQRRVQCSIPKLDELLLKIPQNIIYKSVEPIIRGTPISKIIYSKTRIRNKKNIKNVKISDI